MVTKFPSTANELLGTRGVETEKIQGFAMDIKAAGAASTDVLSTDSLRDPCINCQFLIKKLSVDLGKFKVSSGIEEYKTTANEPTAKNTASSSTSQGTSQGTPHASPKGSPQTPSKDLGNPLVGAGTEILKGVLTAKPPSKP